MKRRGFIQSSGLFVGGISTGFSFIGPDKSQTEELRKLKKVIKFTRDGLDITIPQYRS